MLQNGTNEGKEMTLAEWEDESGYKFQNYLGNPNVKSLADTARLHESGYRAKLWELSDHFVSSVTGGTIWLLKRTRLERVK